MGQKILIVEDNELNMKLFNDLLEAHGYQTVTTRDGTKAVDMAVEEKPDLILMDIQLPEVSGLDITRQIKEKEDLKDIPIIAVTAFAMKGDEDKIKECGCNGYISKPISIATFIETIQNHLETE
jgi:two-component system cell cycle response regulator DivK